MPLFRRFAYLSTLPMLLAAGACSDSPTAASPLFVNGFTLSKVNGQATPAEIASQHITVLGGLLSLAPDGTGSFVYTSLPVIAGDSVRAVDPSFTDCDFTWKAVARTKVTLQCNTGPLDKLTLSMHSDGSVTLTNFGVPWDFTVGAAVASATSRNARSSGARS